jgi:hypothetical protein
MSAALRLVPPVGWGSAARAVAAAGRAARPASLDGLTLGLLANGKTNGDALLDAVAVLLAERHRIAGVVRAAKPHPSLPMSDEVLTMFAEHAHAVLTAVGD